MVRCLAASYTADWRTIFPDDFQIPLSWRKTIGLSVLISCTSIDPIVWFAIILMSSTLAPEETWTEATHDCVLLEKLWVLRGGRFKNNMFLKMFLELTLEASHYFTNIEFMWWCKKIRPILQHPGRFDIIVKKLQFCIGYIFIGMVVAIFACFKDKVFGILVLHVTKGAAVEVAVMSIKKVIWLMIVEAPHKADNCVMDLSHLSLCWTAVAYKGVLSNYERMLVNTALLVLYYSL